MTKYPHINNNPFPKIWQLGGTQKVICDKSHWLLCDNFPTKNVLDYPVNNFRVYVKNNQYFMSQLPPLVITTNYYQSVVRAWLGRYLRSKLTTSYVLWRCAKTSLIRFHLYFTIRQIMHEFTMINGDQINDVLKKYGDVSLKDRILHWTWQELSHTENPRHSTIKDYGLQNHPGIRSVRNVLNDFKKFVPATSSGNTKQRSDLLNRSIITYLYAILGSQTRKKQSIYGERASALETQKVSRELVEDSVVTWVKNMNKAVSETDVIPNTAISPSLWFILSNKIISEKPIQGCNNRLWVASKYMHFSTNSDVNCFGIVEKPEKVHHEVTAHWKTR